MSQSLTRCTILVLVFAICLIAHTASASLIWDESLFGDLSGDRLNPTHIVLAQGANTLIATSSAGDREYVNLKVPAGLILSSINHISWAGIDQIGFQAVQNGTIFTEPPTGTNVANLLGYTHFGPGAGTLGQNLLLLMATGPGAIGFSPPLPSGDYTFWIQQISSPSLTTYRLDYVVTPEPSNAALIGLLVIAGIQRRRRHR